MIKGIAAITSNHELNIYGLFLVRLTGINLDEVALQTVDQVLLVLLMDSTCMHG